MKISYSFIFFVLFLLIFRLIFNKIKGDKKIIYLEFILSILYLFLSITFNFSPNFTFVKYEKVYILMILNKITEIKIIILLILGIILTFFLYKKLPKFKFNYIVNIINSITKFIFLVLIIDFMRFILQFLIGENCKNKFLILIITFLIIIFLKIIYLVKIKK